jgi:hypothetical protein
MAIYLHEQIAIMNITTFCSVRRTRFPFTFLKHPWTAAPVAFLSFEMVESAAESVLTSSSPLKSETERSSESLYDDRLIAFSKSVLSVGMYRANPSMMTDCMR